MMASAFNPNTTRNIVQMNQNNNNNSSGTTTNGRNPPPPQQQQQLQNRPRPLAASHLSPNTANNASGSQNSHSRGPPSVFVLSAPPRRVPMVFLSEPWSTSLCSLAAICHSEAGALSELSELFCCSRCHMMGQLEALRNVPKPEEIDEYERRGWRIPPNPRPLPICFFPCLCFLDIVTAGNPCGGLGWAGIGSTLWGCHIRTRIRKKYRIQGSGLDDLCLSACCSGVAVMQQEREMLNHDCPYRVPCAGDACCSINERMERRRLALTENQEMV